MKNAGNVSANVNTPAAGFSGLAKVYDKFRPNYPVKLLEHLAIGLADDIPKNALDVGSGTGTSTRQLANTLSKDWLIISAEPNEDVHRQVISREFTKTRISYVDSQAKTLEFDPLSIGLVKVAQALHWFDKFKFYGAVTSNILASGTRLAILFNDRELDGVGLLNSFETLMKQEISGYDQYYRKLHSMSEQDHELASLSWVKIVTAHKTKWRKQIPLDAFANLMLSRSKLKPFAKRYGHSAAHEQLVELASGFASNDVLAETRYTARIHVAKKQ